jgi:hypothetical protein
LVIPDDVEVEEVALGGVEAVGAFELAFVVVLAGVEVVPTAVTDGVLLVVLRVGVVVAVALVGELADVLGAAVGVVLGVAVVVGVDRPALKVRSTQYWLERQLSLGKALVVPYLYTPTSEVGIDRLLEAEGPVNS